VRLESWLAYSLLCVVLWGFWGFGMKLAYRGSNWVYVYFISAIASFSLALTVFTLSRGGVNSPSPSWKIVLITLVSGLCGGGGYLCFVKALEKGEASLVVPITALYPALTVVLAILLLGERLTAPKMLGILLALAAGVLISL